MLEGLLLQPATVPRAPILLARENATVPQKKGTNLLLMHPDRFDRCRARPDQVPHRLMRRIGHPHRCELPGPQQARQGRRVTPVRLDPIACLARNERGGDNDAAVAEAGDQSMQPVASGPSLVAAVQPVVLGCQLY
jgi:hypothetical protein